MEHHPPGRLAPDHACHRLLGRCRPVTFVLGVAVLAGALVGCGSSDYGAIDEAASTIDGEPFDSDRQGGDRVEVVTSFADPGEVDGFESVTFDEVDPATEEEAGADPGPLHDEPVEAVIERVADDLDEVAGHDDAPVEALAAVDPIDDGDDSTPERDGRARNEIGELARLDEAANLACANIEIALGALDEGHDSEAAEHLAVAARAAADSGIEDVSEWSDRLAGVSTDPSTEDLATLIGFLSVCTEGGYEL